MSENLQKCLWKVENESCEKLSQECWECLKMCPLALWEASGPKLSDRWAASAMSVGLKSTHLVENSSNLHNDWIWFQLFFCYMFGLQRHRHHRCCPFITQFSPGSFSESPRWHFEVLPTFSRLFFITFIFDFSDTFFWIFRVSVKFLQDFPDVAEINYGWW